MATFTGLTSGTNGSGGSSYTTASVSPSANALVFIGITIGRATAIAETDVTVAGLSGTWVRQGFVARVAATQLATYDLWLFAASDTTGTGTIVITIAGATTDFGGWSVVEATGAAEPSIVGTAVTGSASAATSLTLTLSAFSHANNQAFAVFAQTGANGATTPGSGVTEVHDISAFFGDGALQTSYGAANDTTIDASTAFTDAWQGIAVEVTAEAGGGALTWIPVGVTVGGVSRRAVASGMTPRGGG